MEAIPWSGESAIVPADAVEDMHKLNHNWNSMPLIPCRDCKHFREVPYHDGSIKTKCSGVFTFIEPNPDGFCAWAERDAR